jgi:NSS family neurotransmitter:Na+ symporter
VVTGWTLAYVEFSAAGRSVEFSDFTTSYDPILYFIISAVMMGAIVSLGIKDGIERFTKLLVPFSFLLLLGLFAFSSTLPGFGKGIRFLFTPDFSVLADPLLWGAAFGQAFFSLSVGYGILLTYGDYLDEDVKLLPSSLIITAADLTVAILAGMVIFPVVFTYGLEPAAGAELAFTTLPRAFEVMPYGNLFAVAFFALLFFAAMTSAVSMLEVSAASASHAFGLPRKAVTSALTAGVIVLGLPSALSYSAAGLQFSGMRILDIMDETVGGFGLVLTATLIAVTFTWLLDDELLRREIGWGSRLIFPMVKYAVPAVLALTLATRAFL